MGATSVPLPARGKRRLRTEYEWCVSERVCELARVTFSQAAEVEHAYLNGEKRTLGQKTVPAEEPLNSAL